MGSKLSKIANTMEIVQHAKGILRHKRSEQIYFVMIGLRLLGKGETMLEAFDEGTLTREQLADYIRMVDVAHKQLLMRGHQLRDAVDLTAAALVRNAQLNTAKWHKWTSDEKIAALESILEMIGKALPSAAWVQGQKLSG